MPASTRASRGGVGSIGIQRALAGENGEALYTDYRGVPVIGVYRWIEEHDAALLVELPQAEAFAPAQQLALTIAAVGLGSALLLAVAIWLVARQVTRPSSISRTPPRPSPAAISAASAAMTSRDEVGQPGTGVRRHDRAAARERRDARAPGRGADEPSSARQKQYFESLVEISPAAVVTMDRDERVSGWNPGGDEALRVHTPRRRSAGSSTT